MSHGHRPIYEHSSLLRRRYIFPPAFPELIGIWKVFISRSFRRGLLFTASNVWDGGLVCEKIHSTQMTTGSGKLWHCNGSISRQATT